MARVLCTLVHIFLTVLATEAVNAETLKNISINHCNKDNDFKSYLIVGSLVQACAPIKTRVLLTVVRVHKTVASFKARLADAGVASVCVHTLSVIPARVSSCTLVYIQLTACALVAKWAGTGEFVEVAIRRAGASIETGSS